MQSRISYWATSHLWISCCFLETHKFQGAEVARLWREASAAAHQARQHWQKNVSDILWKHHAARATAAQGTWSSSTAYSLNPFLVRVKTPFRSSLFISYLDPHSRRNLAQRQSAVAKETISWQEQEFWIMVKEYVRNVHNNRKECNPKTRVLLPVCAQGRTTSAEAFLRKFRGSMWCKQAFTRIILSGSLWGLLAEASPHADEKKQVCGREPRKAEGAKTTNAIRKTYAECLSGRSLLL